MDKMWAICHLEIVENEGLH